MDGAFPDIYLLVMTNCKPDQPVSAEFITYLLSVTINIGGRIPSAAHHLPFLFTLVEFFSPIPISSA